MRGIKIISSLIGAAGFIAVAAGFTVPTGNGSEAPKQQGAPYLLDVCPISGRPLPEDGGVVVSCGVHCLGFTDVGGVVESGFYECLFLGDHPQNSIVAPFGGEM